MEAESYGVRDKIHSKRVALTDVAWIDAGQGQYAKVDDAKFSTKDSEGKTLTPEQQEYFKDSKVRDAEGNLLRVYHASVEDFNVFDKDKIRKVDYDAPFNGFWFSNNKNTSPAMRQGKYLKSGYLNVTNSAPLKVWRQVVKEVRNDDVSNPMSRSSNDEVRYRLQDMGYDGVHWDGVPDVDWDKFYADGYVEFNDVRGYKFALRLNEDYGDIDLIDLHYDYGEVVTGYEDRADFEKMQEEVWVAFESNQFKNADNTNPTDSEDVRYSVKEIVGDSGKNYGLGVYLDSNLLEGLTEDERVEMIKEYVKELGGKSFNALDSNGNIVDIVIADNKMFRNSNGKKRPANRDLMYKNNRLPIKQEAITLVDEMVSVATYDSSKAPLYTHGWLDNNGKNDWEYYKVFVQEKNNSVWEATLNVTNSTNGEKILYDINPIKQKERGASINMETSSKKRISQTSEEVNTESKNSLKDGYVIDNNFAVMTKERILREIEDSSAGTNKAYARRYITTISPTDYLNLTTGTRTREFFDEKIGGDYGNKMGEYDYDSELAQNEMTPYLKIDLDNKRVIGHDGRHRMRALEKKGIDSVEIVVEFYNQYGMVKYPNGYDGVAEAIRFLNVIPQDFKYLDDDVIEAIEEEYEKDSPEYNDAVKIASIKNSINNPNARITAVTLEDVMPLNRNYQDRILATYGEDANKEASVKYSQKETPRDILLSTFSGLAQNDIEQK